MLVVENCSNTFLGLEVLESLFSEVYGNVNMG